jgi:hypothetical protein
MKLVVSRAVYGLPRGLLASIVGTSCLVSGVAFAQEAAPTPPPAAPAPAPEPTAAPVEAAPAAPAPAEPAPPVEPPPPAEPVAVEPAEAEPAEAPPEPEKPAFAPSFTIGVGARSGLSLDLGNGTMTLSDGLVDELNVRPFMAGSLTPHVGFFVQAEIGSGSDGADGTVTNSFLPAFQILDAIAQLKVVDEFQVWVGQHIPANDRNNMNGPFFGNTWNFAIAAGGYPFDVGARDRGVTAWGLVAKGRFKYHLSLVDLQPGRDFGQARFAGRVNFHFLEPENFYYNSGTYFGSQDILTVGAVAHLQKGLEDVVDDDLNGFSFDGMFEKNFGKGGTFTAEAGYFNFDETGVNYRGNQGTADLGSGVSGPYPGEGVLGVLSWLTPDAVGPGKIQPNTRIQYGDFAGAKDVVFDAGLAYVIDGFNHKYHLNYRHAERTVGDATTKLDAIQVGFQYMMSK